MIRKPMEISTIEERLAARQYSSSAQFEKDWKLIIDNCKKFNQEGSSICLDAQDMDRCCLLLSVRSVFRYVPFP
ncbi:unnamed protein product [Phaeothamnion confervicola]